MGATLLVASGFYGCEKCTTCDYSYTDPASGETVEVPGQEVCGNNSEIEDYKAEIEAAAESFGGTMTCVDN